MKIWAYAQIFGIVISMVEKIWVWEEEGNYYVFKYDQEENQIFNFQVYSDGFPGHKLSEYTSLRPKNVDTFSELLEIIPIDKLRNLDLINEEEYEN